MAGKNRHDASARTIPPPAALLGMPRVCQAARGVPLNMVRLRPEFLDPSLSDSRVPADVLLRQEPDEEEDEEEDEGGSEENDEDDDDGYSE
jgi:hypothetical protein